MKIKEKLAGNYKETGACTLAFLGDSLTQGAFESDPDSIHGVFDFDCVYHNVLKKMLNARYPSMPVNIINAGIGGETAADALKRVGRDILSHNPDFVVVCFGLNDVGGAYEDYIHALKQIFLTLEEQHLESIFMTPCMLNTYVAEHTHAKLRAYAAETAAYQNSGRVDQYINGAVQTLSGMGIRICDCYKLWKQAAQNGADTTAWLCNGINHPTREKHRIFAEELFKIMTEDEHV